MKMKIHEKFLLYMKNYEKLNGIFLCKLIYDGFFNKINS